MQKSAKVRYNWPDIMKFFGIVMVFAIHSNRAGIYEYFCKTVTLQIFFLCAGMFCARGLTLKFRDFVLQGFRKIMIPYFVFAVLSGALLIVAGNNNLGWGGMLIRSVLGIRDHLHVGTLWFLPTLFCMSVLFYIVYAAGEKLGKSERQRKLIFYSATALIYACGLASAFVLNKIVFSGSNDWHLPWNLDLAAFYLPWYFFGYIIFPWFSKFEFSGTGIRTKILYIVISLIAVCSLVMPEIYRMGYDFVRKLDTVSFYIGNFLLLPIPLAAGLLIVSKWFEKFSFLAKLGQCTLYFCCLEAIFVLIISLIYRFTGLVVPGCPIGGAPANGMPTGIFFACFEVLFMYFLLVPPAKKIFKKIM